MRQSGRVDLVHLVCFVHLVCLVQPNKPNRPNKQEKQAGFRVSRGMVCGAGELFQRPTRAVGRDYGDGPAGGLGDDALKEAVACSVLLESLTKQEFVFSDFHMPSTHPIVRQG